jgi:hypothetical protein
MIKKKFEDYNFTRTAVLRQTNRRRTFKDYGFIRKLLLKARGKIRITEDVSSINIMPAAADIRSSPENVGDNDFNLSFRL